MTIIAALDAERGIGRAGAIPWRLPADLRFFKKVTMGHAILMGRKTYDSIGRALPGRTNLVLSRSMRSDALAPGGDIHLLRDFAEAPTHLAPGQELFVIGGAEIYGLTLPIARRLLLTHIEGTHDCDTFFPEYLHAFRPGRVLLEGPDFRTIEYLPLG